MVWNTPEKHIWNFDYSLSQYRCFCKPPSLCFVHQRCRPELGVPLEGSWEPAMGQALLRWGSPERQLFDSFLLLKSFLLSITLKEQLQRSYLAPGYKCSQCFNPWRTYSILVIDHIALTWGGEHCSTAFAVQVREVFPLNKPVCVQANHRLEKWLNMFQVLFSTTILFISNYSPPTKFLKH